MRQPRDSRLRPRIPAGEHGFTLTELLITLSFLALIMLALGAIMFTASRSKTSSANAIESVQAARSAMDMIADDIRSAGYHADVSQATPQNPIAYVDSLQIILNEDLQPYPSGDVVLPPVAYNPAGNPKPFPLDGTAWTPVMTYTTGAEAIRYTLDANNDGAVDGNDWVDPNGVDAQRSMNPGDYTLLRQMYGDQTGGINGNNGGQTERIALIQKPCTNGAPPLFTVYMKGSSTPYDWSNGPVPPNQLKNVQRVEVRVTAGSSRPDWRGKYTTTELRTQVNSMRNIPNTGQDLYGVNGRVFADVDENGNWSAGDTPLPNVLVRLGNKYSTYTTASGNFTLMVPADNYGLRHIPPPGYGLNMSPDSFAVTVPTTVPSYDFPDTLRHGGWVTVGIWNDADENGYWDASESPIRSQRVTISPSGEFQYTNDSGQATLFAAPGSYTVTATLPDSMVATTANPQTGTMVDGATTTHQIGEVFSEKGTVSGRVFLDNNRNGTTDGSEPGIKNVWVGVSKDNGLTTLGYQYTDSTGRYQISVPINDPPHTAPYSVYIIVPNGFSPTSPSSLSPVWVQANNNSGGFNFGLSGFQTIVLTASRVLSLASADVIEKDWNGGHTENAHGDADIVLGADAGGTDQISVWWNRYDSTPVFSGSPDVSRVAPTSVLSIALDTLDANPNTRRPDLVAGMKKATTPDANFSVWYFQDNPNEGSLSTTFTDTTKVKNYRTADGGEVRAVATLDCAGGPRPDIIVGTASPTAGYGTLEVWQNMEQAPPPAGATPSFIRQEIYPPAGLLPSNRLGEVNAITLADLNNDGLKDLIVGTRTGTYSGEIDIFQQVSKLNGARFVFQKALTVSGQAVTALCITDVNGDGYRDIVAGTQSGAATADLMYWRNRYLTSSPWDFNLERDIAAPGLVQAIAAGDMGGAPAKDVIVGFRTSPTGYGGGVRIYFTDAGTLPLSGVDPSPSGTPIVNMVPAITVNNFNYGVSPVTPLPPYLTDFACGVKLDATTGQLVIFIR